MQILAAAALGLFMGSLITTIAESIPLATSYRELFSPSCPHCDAPRRPLEWSALLSSIGRLWVCSYCGSPRDIRTIGWELLALAGCVSLVASDTGPSGGWVSAGMLGFFLLLAAVDIHFRVVPMILVIPAGLYSLLVAALDPSRGLTKSLLGGAFGFGLVLLMYGFGGLYGRWIARRRGKVLEEVPFGFGDVTLSTFIGLAVGWPGVILALLIGVLGAGAFSLALLMWMISRRKFNPYMPFPYGPFLIVGAGLVYFGGPTLFAP